MPESVEPRAYAREVEIQRSYRSTERQRNEANPPCLAPGRNERPHRESNGREADRDAEDAAEVESHRLSGSVTKAVTFGGRQRTISCSCTLTLTNPRQPANETRTPQGLPD